MSTPINDPIVSLVLAFNAALNERNVDAMMAFLTPDSVFENTYPAPNGTRYEGKQAVREFWEEFFRQSSTARIEPEEIFSAGSRCVMRWIYQWSNPQGESGHIRGVD